MKAATRILPPALFLSMLVGAVAVSTPLAATGVVISEIFYHPVKPNGDRLEFVEIHNPTAQSISIENWSFTGGIDYRFPEGTQLDTGAFAVVAINVEAFREAFPGSTAEVFGDYSGSLSNGGEEIAFADAFGIVVERVVYDDEPPWPPEADGTGSSLHRLCVEGAASSVLNWIAAAPTPFQPSPRESCPPPVPSPPTVVISEIFFNPPNERQGRAPGEDGEELEFIELHNVGGATVDLGGWAFVRGVTFAFAPGTRLPADGILVVCRDEAAVRERFQIGDGGGGARVQVIGNFEGRLANEGERITLIDGSRQVVDSVRYDQADEWPYAADGRGLSLEKIVLAESGDDAANWASSRVPRDRYLPLQATSFPGQRTMSNSVGTAKILLALSGVGEALIDNVLLEDLTEPGGNLLVNGDFENELEKWSPVGNARPSEHSPTGGSGGPGALRLRTDKRCPPDGCGAFDGVSQLVRNIDKTHVYRITAEARLLSGSVSLKAGFLDGTNAKLLWATPGESNSVADERRPPFISEPGRFPRQPAGDEPTWITARVRGFSGVPGALAVRLAYEAGQIRDEVVMTDDGMQLDAVAGDGIFGAELPGFPNNTEVRVRIIAEEEGRPGYFPRPILADAPAPREVWGYYVHDGVHDGVRDAGEEGSSTIPVYHLLYDGVDAENHLALNGAGGLSCGRLKHASFAYRGDLYPEIGLRFRGNTACWIDKRNLKLRFNRGRHFQGVAKMNLNGQWTDKSLVREGLAWDLMRQLGAPYCETYYVRTHLNGVYHGLFIYLEHPDERFLERNGLDPDGSLYKAQQPTNFPIDAAGIDTVQPGSYHLSWEEEASGGGDFSDIETFITAFHEDGDVRNGGPSAAFWRRNSFEEMVLAFQLGNVVLNNIDSSVKNHFLYREPVTDRWGVLSWDLDLVLGKFFLPDAVNFGEGRQVGTLNDFMASDVSRDLTPWSMTSVLGNQRHNWLVDMFFRADRDYYRRAHLVRLWELLEEKYRNEVYDPILAELGVLLEDEARDDLARWGRYTSNVRDFPEDMAANLEIIRGQIAKHRTFLRDFVNRFHPEIPVAPRLRVTELMYFPRQGEEALEYMELVNPGDEEIDVSAWTIPAIDFAFGDGVKVPGGGTVILAQSPTAFRARYADRRFDLVLGPYRGRLSNDGEELRVRDIGSGHPASVDYLVYSSGGDWPVATPGASVELINDNPRLDNSNGRNWRLVPGGSPGSPAVVTFIRGDANRDTLVDVTDAIAMLHAQFLGGDQPTCPDSSDADDSGLLDVTDPTFLLRHLFLGGDAPPAPYPEPGVDSTSDELGECR